MKFSNTDKNNFVEMKKTIKEIIGNFSTQISELSNQKRDIVKEFTNELDNRKITKIRNDLTNN